MDIENTIIAQSTASGGAINVIRLSGERSWSIVSKLFSRIIEEPRKAYFGSLKSQERLIDEVVVVAYKSPNSYTGEDMVEVSCHGSKWVTMEIIRLMMMLGATSATAGEFTKRAFLNGKLNLSEAEAIGDLICSNSKAAAEVALNQMRGGYSKELSLMRAKLVNISALMELELDFAEEDVEFTSREELLSLLEELKQKSKDLCRSFELGNALKNGVAVAIIGEPNVGKSTLLNTLLGEERAIVSSIAGTTRDYLEEVLTIDGVEFRFIDTAGLRETNDTIEKIGVERSKDIMRKSKIIIQLVDDVNSFQDINISSSQSLINVLNKCDTDLSSRERVLFSSDTHNINNNSVDYIKISAKYGNGITKLTDMLLSLIDINNIQMDSVIVSNLRHFNCLQCVLVSIEQVTVGIQEGLSVDLITPFLHDSMRHLGEITGEFTTEEVLGEIFSSFCIGK